MASDEATDKLAKIAKELTCIICTGIFDDPNALHCGHSFCAQCIRSWLETSKTCPVCRVQIVRQPVHITALQQIGKSDSIRSTPPMKKRLAREDWVALFPIENNITFIVDEDEDGIVHRCSQCSWELAEDNYCTRCNIQYDGALPMRNIRDRGESDIDSDMNEPESNLDGFVVSDDEIEFEDDEPATIRGGRRYTNYNSDVEAFSNPPSPTHSNPSSVAHTIEILSDDEDLPTLPIRLNRSTRRIILTSDDDDDDDSDNDAMQYISDGNTPEINGDPSESEDNLDEIEYRGTPRDVYSRPDVSDDEDSELYEDDFPEDPFSRPSGVSRFIDDAAEEDDEEEYTAPQRHQKLDPITETINRARSQMEQNKTSNSTINNTAADDNGSSSSSDDDSDAPDYDFMITQSTPAAAAAAASSSSASTSTTKPSPSKATAAPSKPQKEKGKGKGEASLAVAGAASEGKNKSKEKRKRAKKDKKSKGKHDKKKHKPNE
ncbi:hypothetical protein MBANPS3_000505 [Mucor bainieri]